MAWTNMDAKHKESQMFQSRLWIAAGVIVVVFCVLIGRLVYLQVYEHEKYVTAADNNRYQLQPLAPKRGLIFDRDGRLLAGNRALHRLVIIPEELSGGKRSVEDTIEQLRELVAIDTYDEQRFLRRLNQPRRPYSSIPLLYSLTEVETARIAVNQHSLSGVKIEEDLVRYYPYDEAFVHALGYIGRINDAELEKLDQINYSATNHVGKLGVEKKYENILHGTVGYQTVETNVRGRITRVIEQTAPISGKNISLHLDALLQQKAFELLDGKRGALVALDPKTGGVLALVSTPSYGANQFVTGITSENYKALLESNNLPLFNRAIRGHYPPASTVKPVIALAGIDSGIISRNYKIFDSGYYQITEGGRLYRDWKKGGHGRVDFHKSIVQSVDTYFYDIGHRMGNKPMTSYLAKFGFGQVTIADQPESLHGVLPTVDWKRATRSASWFPGDSLNLSIGQGFLSATPMQLATMTMVLANKGKWQQVRMIKDLEGQPIDKVSQLGFADPPLPADVQLKRDTDWGKIFKAMEGVMKGPAGTARASGEGSAYRIAGKTGTAQVKGIKQDEEYNAEEIAERFRDHGLFIGWAPLYDPQIALAVVIENGGSGSASAAPIARKLMDEYLLSKKPLVANNG